MSAAGATIRTARASRAWAPERIAETRPELPRPRIRTSLPFAMAVEMLVAGEDGGGREDGVE